MNGVDSEADFTADRRMLLLSAMALVIGAAAAAVALALVRLIALVTNLAFYQRLSTVFRSPEGHHLGPLVILVPVVGGLIVGMTARWGSEKIRGHGIPEALEAILFGSSRMETRVAILKPISSAISIGTGGPFGAEGPIIMTGGALGSLFAQLFHLSAVERKTLLVAGAAGGMAAIFASPVAAVLLSVELLLFEWKPRSLIPVAASATVAFLLRTPLLGSGPVFPVLPHPAPGPEVLTLSLLVGILGGLAAAVLTALVYGFEDLFERVPVHWMWWPAISGVFVGVGGLLDPRVLGVGYETIHRLLRGEVVGHALVGLLVIKLLIWSLALGSGTSGGVLAPLLMIGGALGAVEASFLPTGDAGLWVTLSMAATMGGTMRSPFTAMIFTLELTRDFQLLPALLVACMAAHAVTVLLLRRSILTEKVARRGFHVAREYDVDPLTVRRVGDVMDDAPPTVRSTMKLTELSDRIARRDALLTRHQGLPIVDETGSLAGIITRGDLFRALENGGDGDKTVLDAGSQKLVVTYPEEILREAVSRMLRHDIGRLPVVSREDPRRLLGYLGRANVLAARLRKLEEEHLRERGLRA